MHPPGSAPANASASSPLSVSHASTLLPAPKQGGKQLANAILTDNGYAIQQLLNTYKGGTLDVDYVETKHGHPLTTLAVLAGQPHVAIDLIKCGANPLAVNTVGRNVLYIATEAGNLAVVKAIIHMHPTLDLNKPSTTETQLYHPIHVAARYNHRHIVKYLAEMGSALDPEEGEHGYTPLTLSLVLGHQWVASELIELGCNLRARSANGRTPMFVAAEKGLSEIILQVHRTRSFDLDESVVSPSGLRLLHVAAFHGKTNVVTLLLQLGASVNQSDDEGGYSPLSMAVIGNSPTAAIELINAGANVSHSALSGRTPMYVAVEKGMTDVVVKLISEHGVDVNEPTAKESSGSRPLHLALLYNQPHLVSTLLRLGANVNLKDSEKRCTPLQMACILDDEWAARKFLALGALPTETTSEGRNCLYIAAEKGNPALLRLLLDPAGLCRMNINEPCTTEPHRGLPLHIAAMFNNGHAATVLLALGADHLALDARNRRPIDVAKEHNANNVLTILEDIDAKLSAMLASASGAATDSSPSSSSSTA